MLVRIIITISFFLAAISPAFSQQRPYVRFLDELINLRRLAILPPPGETCKQFSSYDRASHDEEHWGANNDRGHYLRKDDEGYVLAEMDGPGCIQRIWSANPAGTIKIYLDGAKKPVINADFVQLIKGNVPPFEPPLVGFRASGANCYMPIPYQRSCKVVVENPDSMYYHINYKTFPKNTKVETFHLPLSEKEKEKLKEVISKLNNAGKSPQPLPKNAKKIERKIRIPPTRTALIAQLPGPAVIYSFKIKIAAENKRDAVRELILKMRWDGKSSPSVWSPLGDFFGSSPGINSYRSLPLGMTEDVLYCYWCMPFARSAKIEITNEGKQDVVIAYQIIYAPIRWNRNIGYFHAKWRRENPNKVFDWPFLRCYGRGRYVGVMLTVWNPVRGWWGEGDEKIWVDGEKWPSTFGTGSEDYFGYAWCSTQLFTHPYHNQTLCEGPGNANYTSVNRWHITDDIPFQKSIKVTIENYGNDKEYACTTFWYADLGQKDFFHPVPLRQRKLHPPRQNP